MRRPRAIPAGGVAQFYGTDDEKAVASVGVVDRLEMLTDAARIASLVSRRAVYGIDKINRMSASLTKVIRFRLLEHLPSPVSYGQLPRQGVVSGTIRSVRQVSDESLS